MIVTVDGNIGSGKSSVLEFIHNKYGISIDLEPVRKWQPYLEDMYYNNSGAFEFQVRVWLDRCFIHEKNQRSTLLMERSPYFQSMVFVPANLENGRITQSQNSMIQEMYSMSMRMWTPQVYIYLRSNPKHCMQRIEERARNSEEAILPEYINRLHELHENAYMMALYNRCLVVCIDVENKTIEEISDEVYQYVKVLS
jgi:deoxyadenosine/deoxycytidine kinase